MHDALLLHRIHFAFTITYHYIFPQLTMGLGLLIVVLKTLALRRDDRVLNQSARFWAAVFGINFAFGVVTGIPMEFQFGTNWARFSAQTGGVIGQTLAMEGLFAFFLESAFLGLFLYGEKRLGRMGHWVAALLVFLGSWVSGYFIVVTNAWMQHPVGHTTAADGSFQVASLPDYLLNPWAIWQYAHTMSGAVVTASFVMAAVGACYTLLGRHGAHAKVFLRTGVVAGLVFSAVQIFPTGDQQGKMVAYHQPATLAAMEALFRTEQGAPLVIVGQPDMQKLSLDNPIYVPRMLSFLTYQRWKAEVKGLDAFPRDQWPTNIPLLYYAYHIMVGLGTIFISIMAVSAFLLWMRRLERSRWMLWMLMLSFPFPYIANTAGWMTAEAGRQPWLVYGLMRVDQGDSIHVSAGNALFTLLGFMGIYGAMSLLFVVLILRIIARGPGEEAAAAH
jgi:cytochrome bd ubiquinol oxidase subunit I